MQRGVRSDMGFVTKVRPHMVTTASEQKLGCSAGCASTLLFRRQVAILRGDRHSTLIQSAGRSKMATKLTSLNRFSQSERPDPRGAASRPRWPGRACRPAERRSKPHLSGRPTAKRSACLHLLLGRRLAGAAPGRRHAAKCTTGADGMADCFDLSQAPLPAPA